MVLWFIFRSGFRILGLAVDFGSQSLFWSDTSAEFTGIPYGFMFYISVSFPDLWISCRLCLVWFPDLWISCGLWKPVFVLLRYKCRVQGNTLWNYVLFFSLVSGSLD